jgi:hypothetical protein
MNDIVRTAPFHAHVMVDTTFVMEQFRPIMTMMEACISNADAAMYRAFDIDGAYMRLFEAADHFLAFELGRKRGNIGFDFYIQEYFAQPAQYLMANQDFMRAGGIYFANAVGYLTRCLNLARLNAEEIGAVVVEVDSTPYNGWGLFTYIVTAHFDNHLYVDVQTPGMVY